MKVEIINPFLIATKKVLSEMLGIDAAMEKPYIRNDKYTDNHLLIMLGVVGQVEGQVVLSFDTTTALSVVSKMCMMEMTEMNDLALSALCELGNMILGNSATVLATSDVLIDITSPSLVQGNAIIKVPQAESICIPFRLGDQHKMEIIVCLKDKKKD